MSLHLLLMLATGSFTFGAENSAAPSIGATGASNFASKVRSDRRQVVVRPAANAKETASTAPWPQFLGPDRNNCSRDRGLLATWPSQGPALLRTVTGLGIGFSNISVADGIVYTMGNHGEREFVLAFKVDTGESVWKFDNAAAYHNGYGDGPRGTPTIDGDRLFAMGGTGELVCLDRKTGSKVWQTNIFKEFESGVPGWGCCESVLIDGDRLICTPGGKTATLVALHKQTGKLLWKAPVPENDRTAYASPIMIEPGGVRQYVQFTSTGTIGIRADDGKFLWRDDSSANGTANCCAPVAAGGMVFTASGYGKGGSMVELSSSGGETTCKFAWHSNDLMVHHGGLVLFDGHIYAAGDNQHLNCVELKTGTLKWKNRCVGKGSLTFADGRLFVRSEGGPVALVEATPAEYKELGKFDQPERSGKPAWPYPVVAGGRLFLRDQDKLFVYDVKGQ
jgi:outer membrane protein assembly factor BamB